MKAAMESPYLTPAEAVAYLKLGSLSALYRAIREHGLPYGRIGRRYRFHRGHLDRWVDVTGTPSSRLQKGAA